MYFFMNALFINYPRPRSFEHLLTRCKTTLKMKSYRAKCKKLASSRFFKLCKHSNMLFIRCISIMVQAYLK